MIVIINSLGVVVYGNPVAQKVFGVSIEDAVGVQARDFLHPDDLEKNLLFFAEVIQTPGTSARQEVRTMSPAGEVRWVSAQFLEPVHQEPGRQEPPRLRDDARTGRMGNRPYPAWRHRS